MILHIRCEGSQASGLGIDGLGHRRSALEPLAGIYPITRSSSYKFPTPKKNMETRKGPNVWRPFFCQGPIQFYLCFGRRLLSSLLSPFSNITIRLILNAPRTPHTACLRNTPGCHPTVPERGTCSVRSVGMIQTPFGDLVRRTWESLPKRWFPQIMAKTRYKEVYLPARNWNRMLNLSSYPYL